MTAATASRRTRILMSAAAIAAGSSLLAGCQLLSPRQTDEMYDAGDGVSTNVGAIELRNLVIVSEKEGAPGVVSGAVGNPTAEAVTLSFTGSGEGGAPVQVSIPAHSTLNLSSGTSKVVMPVIAERPGAMTLSTVSSAQAGNSPVSVPVLEPVGYYADFKAPASTL